MSKATEFVNQWMAAVNRGDLDALVEMTQPDSIHVSPEGTFRGNQGIRDLFSPMFGMTSEREVQITNVVESGDTIVVEFSFRFKNTGAVPTPQGTVPATGKSVTLSSVGVYELHGGKLAGSRGLYDRLSLIGQLGLMPGPAPLSRA
jgi:steroid delta-isomerase-like uncharacterized protein